MTEQTDPEVERVLAETMLIFETYPEGPERRRELRRLLIPFLQLDTTGLVLAEGELE